MAPDINVNYNCTGLGDNIDFLVLQPLNGLKITFDPFHLNNYTELS